MKKGISPVIATVILVAVTLVIAVAIVGWLFGLWGGLAGGSPSIQITNQKLSISDTTATLEVYIRNTGGGSDKILKVELLYGDVTKEGSPDAETIPANFAGWVKVTFTDVTLNAGDTVIIKIYFEKSGTQTFQVTAQAA